MNASCQQENGKFETDCFQILSPDILQLCNVMLLVDWLQVKVSCLHDYISVRLWHNSDNTEWLQQQISALLPFLTMLVGGNS